MGFEHSNKAVYTYFHFLKSQVFSSTLNNSSSFSTSIISYNTTHHQCSHATILAHSALDYEKFTVQ